MFENNDKVLGFPKILPFLFGNTKLLERFFGRNFGKSTSKLYLWKREQTKHEHGICSDADKKRWI